MCKSIIQSLPNNIKVNSLNAVPPQEVEHQLQSHHLYILPTNGENFGHSILESLKCKRPVLISDRTPWKNLNEKTAGWEIDLNQPQQFIDALQEAIDWDDAEFQSFLMGAGKLAEEYVQTPGLKEEYLKLFS